jgi:hypothetical protein
MACFLNLSRGRNRSAAGACFETAQTYFRQLHRCSEVLPGRLKGVINQDEALVDG